MTVPVSSAIDVSPAPPNRRRRVLAAFAVACLLLAALALLPVRTYQGIDYVVGARTLPLYAKAIDFVDRDVNYRQVAARAVPAAASNESKVRAALAWTVANVRDTPDGFPVVDDHIWHIIIRGYGQADQKADVFTTLLTYAGVPAYWMFIGGQPELPLSFVRVGPTWRLVDVENNVLFLNANGALASLDEIVADPAMAAAQGPQTYAGIPYVRFFEKLRVPTPPDATRADLQMPLRRTWFEFRRLVGRPLRSSELRPPSDRP